MVYGGWEVSQGNVGGAGRALIEGFTNKVVGRGGGALLPLDGAQDGAERAVAERRERGRRRIHAELLSLQPPPRTSTKEGEKGRRRLYSLLQQQSALCEASLFRSSLRRTPDTPCLVLNRQLVHRRSREPRSPFTERTPVPHLELARTQAEQERPVVLPTASSVLRGSTRGGGRDTGGDRELDTAKDVTPGQAFKSLPAAIPLYHARLERGRTAPPTFFESDRRCLSR